MIKFLQQSIFSILLIIISVSANGQSKGNTKISESRISPSENVAGFKKQSANSESVIDSRKIDSNKSTLNDSSKQKNNETSFEFKVAQQNNSGETILFDYDQMPRDVQLKIDENKAIGKNGLDGIEKAFTVEIKSCINSELTKNNLAFLNNQIGFIRVEFVSNGIIKIVVQPEFDSVNLKNIMLSEGVDFNFLNEFYLINE